ncbi:MAG TPA: hypothetical protein VG328_07290 [Stellaceae bacterium]|jgi:hypothetical protein|nr:hypothetical protein [Stellaceae bacterium]
MKTAVATAALIALGLAVPSLGHAQGYSNQPSFTIPVPGFNNGANREQQAELNDQYRHCADLRNRADDLRMRVDRAQYRDDAERAQDRLRDVNDQLRHDCSR